MPKDCDRRKDAYSVGLGAVVWDSGLCLSALILSALPRSFFEGRTVVDLGAGTGAVGLACSAAGAERVTLSDREEVCALMEESVALNDPDVAERVSVLKLPWHEASVDAWRGGTFGGSPPDVLMGADLVVVDPDRVCVGLHEELQFALKSYLFACAQETAVDSDSGEERLMKGLVVLAFEERGELQLNKLQNLFGPTTVFFSLPSLELPSEDDLKAVTGIGEGEDVPEGVEEIEIVIQGETDSKGVWSLETEKGKGDVRFLSPVTQPAGGRKDQTPPRKRKGGDERPKQPSFAGPPLFSSSTPSERPSRRPSSLYVHGEILSRSFASRPIEGPVESASSARGVVPLYGRGSEKGEEAEEVDGRKEHNLPKGSSAEPTRARIFQVTGAPGFVAPSARLLLMVPERPDLRLASPLPAPPEVQIRDEGEGPRETPRTFRHKSLEELIDALHQVGAEVEEIPPSFFAPRDPFEDEGDGGKQHDLNNSRIGWRDHFWP
uniref:Uncharacterized protein n=1 Tax=Chromera velia CCMP2878 TaxID=1169474 RepID=A0A0G4GRZ8_9ALVE|eukprot:Cvel_5117.t1-p1 / transcript=Cvel_5117.t1 / gene=Cvel_5117 / organism=Chromera_velia_CCMP2878 / gene_product=Protein-lysine methyltransferase METTL21A, putative / transcript_product=Protein-lysine methyltransferase METTL21A, putative / location=Cvel_scaffold234:28388-32371(-) / protein_length=492 / sequence_SO=supercontig / SO=protein_coding / is_pseudo=false